MSSNQQPPKDASGKFRRPAQSIVHDVEPQADSQQPPSASVRHGAPPTGPLTPPSQAAPEPVTPADLAARGRPSTVAPGELAERPYRDPRKNSLIG